MIFSEWLKNIRKSKGYSQEKLATLIKSGGGGKVTSQQVHAWEKGEYEPGRKNLTVICEIFGESPHISISQNKDQNKVFSGAVEEPAGKYLKGEKNTKTVDVPNEEVVGSRNSENLSPEERKMRDDVLEKLIALGGENALLRQEVADLKEQLKKKDGTNHPK